MYGFVRDPSEGTLVPHQTTHEVSHDDQRVLVLHELPLGEPGISGPLLLLRREPEPDSVNNPVDCLTAGSNAVRPTPTWQGQPIAASSAGEGLRDAFRELATLALAALLLVRVGSLLLAVSAFSDAATQFTSHFGNANSGMGSLCTGLACVAFGYLLPRYADARTFIASKQ